MKYNTEEIEEERMDEKHYENRVLLGRIIDYDDMKEYRESERSKKMKRYNGSDELMYKRGLDEYIEYWGEYVREFN